MCSFKGTWRTLKSKVVAALGNVPVLALGRNLRLTMVYFCGCHGTLYSFAQLTRDANATVLSKVLFSFLTTAESLDSAGSRTGSTRSAERGCITESESITIVHWLLGGALASTEVGRRTERWEPVS